MYKFDLLTYSRFTRTPAPGEGFRFLRGAPKAIPLPKGPGLRTCASEQPFATSGRTKTISFVTEGIGLCAYASRQPSVTFGLPKVISFVPKVMVFELALLSVHSIPSDMVGFLPLGPANKLGSISEGEGLTRRSIPQHMSRNRAKVRKRGRSGDVLHGQCRRESG